MAAFDTPAKLLVTSPLLGKAATIFEYTHASATSLIGAFDDAKAKRGRRRGVLTDQEQDILRAALVMCCAGTDAALKQAIRDCLVSMLERSDDVRRGFEDFIAKRLAGQAETREANQATRFLAAVLAGPDPREKLIEEYIRALTGDSLQSVDEVLRVTAALGFDAKALRLDIVRLREVFAIRNKIIHELDIDLGARVRKRKVRSQADLLANADFMLATISGILVQLDKALG